MSVTMAKIFASYLEIKSLKINKRLRNVTAKKSLRVKQQYAGVIRSYQVGLEYPHSLLHKSKLVMKNLSLRAGCGSYCKSFGFIHKCI